MSNSLRATRDEELQALIAEQERDAQWGHRAPQRGVSLDYDFAEGGSFADIVGYGASGETGQRRVARPQKWTRRQIVRHIRAWVKEHGETPMYADWNRPNGRGIPSSASLARHFGSFDAAIIAAGFEPRGVGGAQRQASPKKYGRKRVRKIKTGARLTRKQLAAAYVLYDRQKLSTAQLGEALWERYGYPHAKACTQALCHGFHAEGFRMRTRSEARQALPEETRREIHRRMDAARPRKLTAEQIEAIRAARGSERQIDTAARFGISQAQVSRIQLRKMYV